MQTCGFTDCVHAREILPYEDHQLYLCGKCLSISYCCIECQTADWLVHQTVCAVDKFATLFAYIDQDNLSPEEIENRSLDARLGSSIDQTFMAIQNRKQIPVNIEFVEGWLEKASANFCPIAQYYLASLNYEPVNSFALYSSSANAGFALSQYELGVLLLTGSHNVRMDQVKAIHWFGCAAAQGHAKSMSFIATCYYTGNGIRKNVSLALAFAEHAADLGEEFAMHLLAIVYLRGCDGVSKNMDKAFGMMLRAASLGHTPSQHNVGTFFFRGDGVGQDIHRAEGWFSVAAKKGFQPSILALAEIKLG